MAKGNMLLGYSRGSVGDVVFYRDGGLQRTRARNRNPRNPKSSKQMLQRSLLANCVKFYKVATAGLFKFGFETKKPNESDYNAFVRVNIKRGVNISKTAFDTPWYGAIGHWRMTEGSLQPAENVINASKAYFDLGVQPSESVPATPTVGWLSSQLIAAAPNRYMVGDIVTYCVYTAETPSNGMPAVNPQRGSGAAGKFTLSQFRLNTADEREVNDVLQVTGYLTTVNGNLAIGYGADSATAAEEWAMGLISACLILSRNTAEGTKVSTADLLGNTAWETAITACADTDYISAVLADWQAGGEAILQGGASTDYVNPFDYATSIGGSVGVVESQSSASETMSYPAIQDGAVRLFISKQWVQYVQMNMHFDTAAHATDAFNMIQGEIVDDHKVLSTFSMTYGETAMSFTRAYASLDTPNRQIIFMCNATTNSERYHVADVGTFHFSAQGIEIDVSATFRTENYIVSAAVGLDPQSELPINLAYNTGSKIIVISAKYKGTLPVIADFTFDDRIISEVTQVQSSGTGECTIRTVGSSIPQSGISGYLKYGEQILAEITGS